MTENRMHVISSVLDFHTAEYNSATNDKRLHCRVWQRTACMVFAGAKHNARLEADLPVHGHAYFDRAEHCIYFQNRSIFCHVRLQEIELHAAKNSGCGSLLEFLIGNDLFNRRKYAFRVKYSRRQRQGCRFRPHCLPHEQRTQPNQEPGPHGAPSEVAQTRCEEQHSPDQHDSTADHIAAAAAHSWMHEFLDHENDKNDRPITPKILDMYVSGGIEQKESADRNRNKSGNQGALVAAFICHTASPVPDMTAWSSPLAPDPTAK